MMSLAEQLAESAAFISAQTDVDFDSAVYVTLGSGFKYILDDLPASHVISLANIPHVKSPHVAGHGSELVVTKLSGAQLIVQTGRTHYYEGHPISDVVYTTQLAATLGIKKFVCTNASGSLNPDFTPGTLVLIEDHINMTGQNALIGRSGSLTERFVDMLGCYDPAWIKLAQAKLALPTAVYIGVTGPTYETAAETRMLAQLGGDLVGMSTVHEVIAARQLGMRVMGVSLATNFAAGIATEINHTEVLAAGKTAASKVKRLFSQLIDITQNN